MLRVRNEARWIEPVLRSIQGCCDEIHVMDDGSDDGTPEICERMGVNLYHSPFSTLDETRDKNWLLDRIESKTIPDVILCIDGDEELEPGGAEVLRASAQSGTCWSLKVAYLWNDPRTVRTDRVYGRFQRASMWRHTRGLRFPATGNGGNFHCGNVPVSVRKSIIQLPVKLLHYGYMHSEDRIRKYRWYNQKDPNDAIEDFYRHIVIGDLFPAESRFVHAGPLQLEPLKCLSVA